MNQVIVETIYQAYEENYSDFIKETLTRKKYTFIFMKLFVDYMTYQEEMMEVITRRARRCFLNHIDFVPCPCINCSVCRREYIYKSLINSINKTPHKEA